MRPFSGMAGLILMTLMIVAAGMNSVTDLMKSADAGHHTADCEYCAINESPVWVPPAGLSLPALILDLAPRSLLPLLTPTLCTEQAPAEPLTS
ncbi:MAG: hypothetical protein CMI02_20160 [Oceanospirillaceae bacterium]|nr:hypothetical protein [Oceanospirillaceae bacterium]MBT14344.1 hypothetical protein [Oceanospirillaceae bacterium]|tara:strand:+ start:3981 stop:4259 length:279 start_codon:yes stop_codon:yes gene_type:complete